MGKTSTRLETTSFESQDKIIVRLGTASMRRLSLIEETWDSLIDETTDNIIDETMDNIIARLWTILMRLRTILTRLGTTLRRLGTTLTRLENVI